ncbi:N-acetyltransferase [uncultured Streptococcus sp.]|uniref:GNAT family N-acetyltransferase n=1 Tax=uncultured Streptococcus sp. TaxID=83427 RepID=UPI0027DD1004|nr:N-acetyltransferase [uncultured Streptococcus sp.]
MLIRQATTEDLDEVLAIEESNFSAAEAMSREAIDNHIRKIPDTFLIAEIDGAVAGYIEGPVVAEAVLTDDLFLDVAPNQPVAGFVAVTSLSIHPDFKGQGIGTALLAAMKDVVAARQGKGIVLTCHDYLIAYYEMNGFVDQGESASTYANEVWYDMLWLNA